MCQECWPGLPHPLSVVSGYETKKFYAIAIFEFSLANFIYVFIYLFFCKWNKAVTILLLVYIV